MKTKTKITVGTWRFYRFCLVTAGVVVAAFWLFYYPFGQEWQSWWGWVWRYLFTFVVGVAILWGAEWYDRRERAARADASYEDKADSHHDHLNCENNDDSDYSYDSASGCDYDYDVA